MLKTLNRALVQLAATLSANSTVVMIMPNVLGQLNALAVGDHVLLDLADGRGAETVQYTHTAPLTLTAGLIHLPITRAVEGTALNWPKHHCLHQSTGEVYLAQMICKHMGNCP